MRSWVCFRMMVAGLGFVLLLGLTTATALAEEPTPADREASVRSAVARGLTLVQKAAARYPEHRDCFSCHHQTLPMLAIRAARDAGLEADWAVIQSQLEFTQDFLKPKTESLKEGKHVGGRAMTVAYALWSWQIAEAKPEDPLKEALVEYLLATQEERGRWKPQTIRPPLEESSVSCTVLAAWMLNYFAGTAQREKVNKSLEKARGWLRTAELKHQEDYVFALWGKSLLGEPPGDLAPLVKTLVKAQKPDGSWSQEPEMAGDAYATGQAVFVLEEVATSTPDAPTETAISKGVDWLLKSQEADGSWHVVTRSKPIQTLFDNGDPHGNDQFISTPATAWATAALARALPRAEKK